MVIGLTTFVVVDSIMHTIENAMGIRDKRHFVFTLTDLATGLMGISFMVKLL